MTHPPYWKLVRLAPRSIAVVETHGASEPAIQIYATTLIPAAHAMRDAHGRARTFAGSRAIALNRGKQAVAFLLSRLRAWTSVVDRSLDGFDVKAFGVRPDVPEDVIHDAEDLIELVQSKAEATAHLVEPLVADLGSATEAARNLWAEANDAGTQQVALQRDLKAAAVAFHGELVAFRKTLAAILGRNHRDYQRLRASTVKAAPADGDTEANETSEIGPEATDAPQVSRTEEEAAAE